LENLLFN